jgi:hypothetical protein
LRKRNWSELPEDEFFHLNPRLSKIELRRESEPLVNGGYHLDPTI